MPLSTLAGELWGFLKDRDFVLANGNLRGWTHRIFEMDQPRQYLGRSGGGGLGSGIGAAIGAALAHHDLPVLVIMDNNRTYYNSEEHQRNVAVARDRDVERAGIGTKIENPHVDSAARAKSMGVWAIGPVEKPEDVEAAIAQALEVVEKQKRPAWVDIVTNKVGYENA